MSTCLIYFIIDLLCYYSKYKTYEAIIIDIFMMIVGYLFGNFLKYH